MEPYVLVLVVLAFAVTVIVLAGVAEKARSERLAQAARAAGWSPLPGAGHLAERWQGSPFGKGRGRRITDALSGTLDGYRLVSFTYSWTTGTGKDSRTHHVHVVALDERPGAPAVSLTPDGFGAKVVKLFGGQDVVLGNPAFDERWRVTGDEAFSRRVLDAGLTNQLLEPGYGGAHVRIEGPSVLLWWSGRTSPALLVGRAGLLVGLARRVAPQDAADDGWGDRPRDETPGGIQDLPDWGTPPGGP